MKEEFVTGDDDLGLPWEKLADGLPHRLKRKRDFPDVDPEFVRAAAKRAAGQMGKAVQTLPDKMSLIPNRYLWVQFADHEIRVGEACKCGGRRLLRVHPSFARCTQCGAQLLLAPAKREPGAEPIESADYDEDEEDGRPEPAALLQGLTEVHLKRLEHVDDRETYRGYGLLAGAPVFLLAQFRADPGEALSSTQALEQVAAVQVLPLRHLDGLLSASALMDENTEWDLVL